MPVVGFEPYGGGGGEAGGVEALRYLFRRRLLPEETAAKIQEEQAQETAAGQRERETAQYKASQIEQPQAAAAYEYMRAHPGILTGQFEQPAAGAAGPAGPTAPPSAGAAGAAQGTAPAQPTPAAPAPTIPLAAAPGVMGYVQDVGKIVAGERAKVEYMEQLLGRMQQMAAGVGRPANAGQTPLPPIVPVGKSPVPGAAGGAAGVSGSSSTPPTAAAPIMRPRTEMGITAFGPHFTQTYTEPATSSLTPDSVAMALYQHPFAELPPQYQQSVLDHFTDLSARMTGAKAGAGEAGRLTTEDKLVGALERIAGARAAGSAMGRRNVGNQADLDSLWMPNEGDFAANLPQYQDFGRADLVRAGGIDVRTRGNVQKILDTEQGAAAAHGHIDEIRQGVMDAVRAGLIPPAGKGLTQAYINAWNRSIRDKTNPFLSRLTALKVGDLQILKGMTPPTGNRFGFAMVRYMNTANSAEISEPFTEEAALATLDAWDRIIEINRQARGMATVTRRPGQVMPPLPRTPNFRYNPKTGRLEKQ